MIKLYDLNMNLVAVLQNAYGISYEKRMNELWTASFSLPADDPKNAECLPFRFVEIFDGDERVELFRILPSKFGKSGDGLTMTYQCEHVLSTLLDDILFQYHQASNLSPANTLAYILSKQTTQRWAVGTVDFTALYEYKWENENLLSALFSIPKAYSEEYIWTWDTTVTPWRLNLVRPPSEISAYIRYGKNLIGIEKDEDPTYVITRLYPLGYGEGVNQLTIKDVNGGVPYIDADTINIYGVIAATFIDKTEENPATLKAKALAELEKAKIPRVSYSVNAADIYQITKDPIDRFRDPGALVQVYDEESGLEFTARVVTVNKSNIDSNPGDIKIEISNKVLDITDTTTSLLNRQRISEVYAQGATNIDSNDYQDNCDNTHPAIIQFYLPNETVRVNKCLLSYKVEAFRAYSRATKGGGGLSFTESFNNIGSIDYGVVLDSLKSFIVPAGEHAHGGKTGVTEGTGLPAHDHTISTNFAHYHQLYDFQLAFTLPNHIHDIEYGIYEFPEIPQTVTIKVDGNTIPYNGNQGTDIDLVPYLSIDSNSKIKRGAFHKVEIFPDVDNTIDPETGLARNPLGLARITASIVKQIFVQSRGGGDY